MDRQGRMAIVSQEKFIYPISDRFTSTAGLDAEGKHRWDYANPAGGAWSDGKYGFIDKTHKLVVEVHHESAAS